jgi:hypothetical protein
MLEEIAARLRESGLILRGGLHFARGEDRPSGPGGERAGSVMLVGNAGADYWRHFNCWRARQPADLADPLDCWSREVIGAVAQKAGARVLMPNDRPFAPFQQWAMRAEGLKPSPLGLLIHPRYGLWHAFRGALLFDEEIALPDVERSNHPCAVCDGKPCLKACPVGAQSEAGFAYAACVSHVRGADGQTCREGGCIARNACPVGERYRYPAPVQAFHQKAFAGF